MIVGRGGFDGGEWQVEVRDAMPGRAEVDFRLLGAQGLFGAGFRTDFRGIGLISRGVVNNGRDRFLLAVVDATHRRATFRYGDGTAAEHVELDTRHAFGITVLVAGPVSVWPELLEVELEDGQLVRQRVSLRF